MNKPYTIPGGAAIGHVHLKVSNLARAEAFYCGLLGFEVVTRYGEDAVFISAGGYHHHIGLNTWYSKGAPPAPRQSSGLFIRLSSTLPAGIWLSQSPGSWRRPIR